MSTRSISYPSPARSPSPTLSVVLSFYNEARVLPELLRRLRATLQPEVAAARLGGYELVFVNDASTDDSRSLLTAESEAAGDVIVINMTRNFGVSECVLAGMRYAAGNLVVYMDADLQDPPELIPQLLAAWRADADCEVVYTTRTRRAGEHVLKRGLTKVGYRFINAISDIHLPIDSGDFKLLTRRAVEQLLRLEEKSPYLRGLVSWIGFKQVQVSYERQARFDGRSGTKFPVLSKRVIWGYLDKALISFSDVPLKAGLVVGFAVSVAALAYIVVVLVQKVMGWYEPGWPALMAAILLLGGMQLLMLGILGLYIKVIFLETKRRPNYVVESLIAPAEWPGWARVPPPGGGTR